MATCDIGFGIWLLEALQLGVLELYFLGDILQCQGYRMIVLGLIHQNNTCLLLNMLHATRSPQFGSPMGASMLSKLWLLATSEEMAVLRKRTCIGCRFMLDTGSSLAWATFHFSPGSIECKSKELLPTLI